jgi:hypothetical protein
VDGRKGVLGRIERRYERPDVVEPELDPKLLEPEKPR